MQRLIYLFPAVTLLLLLSPSHSDAQRYDPYRWCAQYGGADGDGGRNCGFVTWEQCMAAISGVGGICEPNQFYTGPGGFYAGPEPYERRIPRRYRYRDGPYR